MAFIPNDTLFTSQWHLLNTTPGEYDLNVVDVWDDYDGSGVRVAVLDRGFDYDHPEFDNSRYLSHLDWDFRDDDPFPEYAIDPDLTDDDWVDAHGTPSLGIIGASQDGVGTVGIAFGADLIGYRTNWGQSQVEDAIEMATVDNHDIITMSYGLSEGVFQHRNGLVDAAEAAAEDGRDGLGMIIVKSAGNSRRDANNIYREETTGEALENSRHTIVVAGASDVGEIPVIFDQNGLPTDDNGANKSSSPGANILTTAFYGRDGTSVQTTDISGDQGYVSDDASENYTGFTGTSAAAPQVAGVIALMLEANPNLGWRDVQDIIAYSSRHIGSDVGELAEGEEQATQYDGSTWFWNDAQDWNGGGLHYSNDFGFGLIDAKAAVRLAETWSTQHTSANEVNPNRVDGLNREVTIAEGSTTGGFTVWALRFADGIDIENITLGINFVDVADLADLEVYLTSPGGTRVQLIADTGDFENWSGYWRFGSTAFRGESSEGRWLVQIGDDDNSVTSPITINDIDLWTHGSNESNDDLFIFTNEYARYAGVDGHATDIVGGAGHDVINAAAMDSRVIIDLQSGDGVIAGHVISMSGIEEVFGGDSNDQLYDGAGANELWGGRGNDVLRDTSAGGNDIYHGNRGHDTMQVYSAIGGDAFYGGRGRDTIDWRNSSETTATFDLVQGEARDSNGNVEIMESFQHLIGTAYGDTIIENGRSNNIDGHDGNDTIIVTTNIDNDDFFGGLGRDTIDWRASTEAGATYNMMAGTATDNSGNVETMDGFEDLIGTDNFDIVVENNATNTINTRSGDDLLRVMTVIGNDSFNGGNGSDTIDWSGSAQVNGVYDLAAGTASRGSFVETMVNFENFFGSHQADTIIESFFANVISGGRGDDTVVVTTMIGSDIFAGGGGVDTIDWSGSAQENGHYDMSVGRATAGAETETMNGFENFIGTNQSDIIVENAAINVINSGGADDVLWVNSAIDGDSFTGGAGRDMINWSLSDQANGIYDMSAGTAQFGSQTEIMSGFENIIGSLQRDTIIEGSGTNNIDANGGNDHVIVTSLIVSDYFSGGLGIDTIDWSGSAQEDGTYDLAFGLASGGTQHEVMSHFERFIGTNQSDTIIEGFQTNSIAGGGGRDLVVARSATLDGTYDGGAGIDRMDWQNVQLQDAVFDLLNGTITANGGLSTTMENFENLIGTWTSDTVRGTSADNDIRGMAGNDLIFGRSGNDALRGGGGHDEIRGGGGQDTLLGGGGDDNLLGGGGADILTDGAGADLMWGQNGNDVFDFGVDDSVDRILDFSQGEDQIRLTGFDFDNLTITDLATGNIRVQYGADLLIIHDPQDSLSASDLSSSDFLFA